ncbi:MAG: hypothetical protein V3V62_03100 [bacterium]
MRMRLLAALLALAAALLAFASPAGAARIRVSQESRPGRGDFDRNVLGFIDAMWGRGMTAARFYAYTEVAEYSYNGPHPRLRPDVSHLFLVEAKEGLVLFIVHDRPNDPDGGSAAMRFELAGDPDGARVLVMDDPYSDLDSYEGRSGGRSFVSRHGWYPCCTDGLALGTLDGSWKLLVQFGEENDEAEFIPISGLKSWLAFSANGARVPLKLERGRRVRLEPIGPLVRHAPPGRAPGARPPRLTASSKRSVIR